jgi:hypothetical protein
MSYRAGTHPAELATLRAQEAKLFDAPAARRA